MEIRGKVAVVTGAAAGIGRAVAGALADEGAAVVVADVDPEEGRPAAEEVGGRFVSADVLVDADLRALIGGAEGLEIVVNNAGGAPGPHFPEARSTIGAAPSTSTSAAPWSRPSSRSRQ